jgi:DNA-binding NtrC family response regulator
MAAGLASRCCQRRNPAADPFSGAGTVLVMDDEKVVRDMLARMLERLGYRVLCACDGTEARQLFARKEQPAIHAQR